MANPLPTNLEKIDKDLLTPLVRQSLRREGAEIIDWKTEKLYGASSNSEIHRFSGTARDRGEALPWSLVLKIIRSAEGHEDPAALRYWKREALAYQSGLLDELPEMICAPRCYGIAEQAESETWLWLEEIVDEWSGRWSLDQYGLAARHLGQFNAAGFGKQAIYSQPWMTKNQLRVWVGDEAPVIPPEVLAHPLVGQIWPDDIYQWMQRVWWEHEAWIDRVELQPQTLAHLDAFRRNMFARHDKKGNLQTVMIDWAFVGSAAAGEEIAPLVPGSLNFLEFDSGQAEALDQAVFEGYLEGLREAGWHGDPQAVRSTYAASAVLKFSIGVCGVAFMIADDSQHSFLEQAFGHPLEELVEVWSKTNRFLYHLSDEARRL